MTRDEARAYWLESSEEHFRSMHNMFRAGEYSWALFLGHLVLEKMLKALHVQVKGTEIPRTHDLLRLAVLCGLDPTEEQKDALQEITLFNLETRYDDYRREFAHKCTKEFTAEKIGLIERTRQWLQHETSK